MSQIAVIFPAAGRSSRFRDKEKKPFANLEGRAVFLRTLELFVTRSNVSQILVTGPGAPAVASVDDLSGKDVFVRENSTHQQSLQYAHQST